MRHTRSIIPTLHLDHGPAETTPDSGRRGGRMLVEGIKCNRGRLLDLSKMGARISCLRRWPEGERRRVVLTGSRVQVRVTAECRHCEKIGFCRYVVGLKFEECDGNISAALLELVRTHCRFLDEPEDLL